MQQQFVIALLLASCAGAITYVFAYPYFSGSAKAQKRQAALTARSERQAGKGADQARRRKAVSESLKEVEQVQKTVNLEQRLEQAGLAWSKSSFYLGSAACALLFGAAVLVLSNSPLAALGGAAAGAFGFPNWLLGYLGNRRMNKFVEEFPGAIDVIIRGVKAGLPVGDCFRVVASEGQEPVRSEFRRIVEAQTIGMTMGEAVERFAERVPVPEASFFSIVINLQQKAGGNLSEALANLSRVLRDRKKMKAKVKAVSSEAKASAGIIGSLPFLVGGAVYLTNQSYMMILFTTTVGNAVIIGGLIWMAIGVLVMRKMINFDF